MNARMIRRKAGLTLVEWVDAAGLPHRNWVPPYFIVSERDNLLEVTDPEAGIQYGLDFSQLFVPRITSQDLDRELKKKGIWTADDLRTRPNEALAALRDLYGIDLAALLNAVAEYEQQES